MTMLGIRGRCPSREKVRFLYAVIVGCLWLSLCAICGAQKRDR